MLFKVDMTVKIPLGYPAAELEDIKQREKAYSQQLQREGTWRHIWRVAGLYANVSIFDVRDADHLHQILMGLPLYPFMEIRVEALCRHPSSIREDDS
ncbi:TPA: muconolactone Delta-isomerase [Raoultella planticola]|uniref:muconolactone Delta-isomerase n=1 Tax=Raoultella planticola TaxID=575 RepID=UPI001A1A8ADF|nr:muconolactone Delta-isomerase [Raoultella planticola]HAT1619735.1 muconolactone Delta-isomerase [Raoultella planticola]